MHWRRALLIPAVVRLVVRAPRDRSSRWDRFWAATGRTGDGGDVLWDADRSGESERLAALLARDADAALPVVDVGCGNGRLTRALAAHFPRAVGVDVSVAAVERARQESAGEATFRVADLVAPGTGALLADVVGESNVAIRGVLHVLDPAERLRMAASVAALAGARGTVLVAETNYRGSLLGYLESLGARPRGVPLPLARALSSGLPAPTAIGVPELDACFPPEAWERLHVDADAIITTVEGDVPGLVAVLRRRRPGSLDREAG